MNIANVLTRAGFMDAKAGAWVLVDGQYGSTGKGLIAGALAEAFAGEFAEATCNAGPNSGHTSYYRGEQIVLKQLPTFGVVGRKAGASIGISMNAGAIVAPETLFHEIENYAQFRAVLIHPNAAMVTDSAIQMEKELIGLIGSTGKGTGGALARKILRDPDGVIGAYRGEMPTFMVLDGMDYDPERERVFVEVSQGFSLGINRGFYPHSTSRNCDVGQALSDAEIHPSFLRKTIMVCRTFPIRVGGNSGGCYPDQREITWDELGIKPELTTVTKKQRRIFTWSRKQFREAVRANRPDVVVLNFMNYLDAAKGDELIDTVLMDYKSVMGRPLPVMIGGYGPEASDLGVLHATHSELA